MQGIPHSSVVLQHLLSLRLTAVLLCNLIDCSGMLKRAAESTEGMRKGSAEKLVGGEAEMAFKCAACELREVLPLGNEGFC